MAAARRSVRRGSSEGKRRVKTLSPCNKPCLVERADPAPPREQFPGNPTNSERLRHPRRLGLGQLPGPWLGFVLEGRDEVVAATENLLAELFEEQGIDAFAGFGEFWIAHPTAEDELELGG